MFPLNVPKVFFLIEEDAKFYGFFKRKFWWGFWIWKSPFSKFSGAQNAAIKIKIRDLDAWCMIMIFFNILRVRAINLNEAAFCNGKVIDSIFNLTLITALNEVQKLKCFHFKILWLSRLYQYAALNCKKHDELPSSIENIGTKAA